MNRIGTISDEPTPRSVIILHEYGDQTESKTNSKQQQQQQQQIITTAIILLTAKPAPSLSCCPISLRSVVYPILENNDNGTYNCRMLTLSIELSSILLYLFRVQVEIEDCVS